jgi:acyl carrier protein phosphodiesterase
MNFLAHLYLSGAYDEIKIGNFIGDFVKGRNLAERYGAAIAKGVDHHREIDHFTDHHPIVQESKNRLRPKYRHYSPVIVDVFYDHFLAHKWNDYSDKLLPDFADQTYDLMEKNYSVLPDQVNFMLPYMIKGNWLVNYSKLEGIHRALSGMARRTPYKSKMEEATEDLRLYYSDFENEFNQFFPQLIVFSNDWLKNNYAFV